MKYAGENAAHGQFRDFMARCVLLATSLNSIVVAVLMSVGIFSIPAYHQALVFTQGGLCFVFYLAIRYRPGYLPVAVWFYIISTVCVGTSTDLMNVADPMRFTWHFATTSAALIIGGLPAGIIVTLASLVSVVVANHIYGLLPEVGIVTLCSALTVTFVVMTILVQYVYRTLNDLQMSRDNLDKLAHTDALTGLPNRLAFDRYLASKVASERDFSLAILDLDRFKHINDTYGHALGDTVLKEVASILANTDADMAARFGGEEFCLLFADIDSRSAQQQIDDIRRRIEHRPVRAADGGIHVTASFGFVHSSAPHRSGSALLSAADHALYDAKSAGRNRCAAAA
ncbi:GGDEF domain-containing protein [Salinisphaera sp. Q1T1-3]|nr:GGDEF domain-containing protein [Salinisphaera sp. Q1T1-3]